MVQGNYPFSEALNLISKYEGKPFFEIRVRTFSIIELRVMNVNFSFKSLWTYLSNRKYT